MLLFVIAYLGGVLTIVSPCILPVLPFVFARTGQSFGRSTLPMLLGMAITFGAVATLAAFGGGWAVSTNAYARAGALVLMALFGIALLFPSVADRAMRPLVGLGARLGNSADRFEGGQVLPSLVLGVATGLLWAPCAGPVLGLILTGAALHGANAETSLLLLAYALGAATSLALALLVGGRVFRLMKRGLGIGEWIRRALGAAVLAAVIAIAAGLDRTVLTSVSLARTNALEQGLLDRFGSHPEPAAAVAARPMPAGPAPAGSDLAANLPAEGTLPSLAGAAAWLNSPPLTPAMLKGHVVLVDFWTYSCINCLRELPYVRAWAAKYATSGLVVVGVHAPEFAFEHDVANVRRATASLGIAFPVAIDNGYAIWRAFNNEYWPTEYVAGADGTIRHHVFGEGDYDATEHVIQALLRASGRTGVPGGLVSVDASGVQAASDSSDVRSPETYIGTERAQNFVSPGGPVPGVAHVYRPGMPDLNQWGLAGNWTVGEQSATLDAPDGEIVFRFHARDLHLVLGPEAGGRAVRFVVTIDGHAPGADHGTDADPQGRGSVTGQRLYQLVRQHGPVANHDFAIRFLDPGVQAFSFTFG